MSWDQVDIEMAKRALGDDKWERVMTINEMIEHCEEVAEKHGCSRCGMEHKQLAKHLQRLKNLQSVGSKIRNTISDINNYDSDDFTPPECTEEEFEEWREYIFESILPHAAEIAISILEDALEEVMS